MVDSVRIVKVYQDVLSRTPKEDSRHVTDAETAALYDQIAAEVAAIRAENPTAQFAIPNEIPDSDDLPGQAAEPS